MTARAWPPEPPWDCWIGDLLVRLRLPVLDERGVEVCVQLARGVVGRVEQRLGNGRSGKRHHQRTHDSETRQDPHRDLSFNHPDPFRS